MPFVIQGGHVIRYHYRLAQLAPELINLSGHTRIPAIIIFVDSFKRATVEGHRWEVSYFPLRVCEITRFPWLLNQPSEARAEFPLKLGQYVRYDHAGPKEQWHSRISQFDESRVLDDRGTPRYFGISGANLFSSELQGDLANDWETLVRFVSRSEQMKNAVFMRLSKPQLRRTRLRRFRELMEIPAPPVLAKEIEPYTEDSLTSYTVRPAKEYRIDITIYDSPSTATGLGQHSGLEIKSSSDQVYVAQPFHSVVSGLLERSAILTFKRTTERLLTTLAFFVTETKNDTTTNTPVLHLYVTPWLWVLIFFLVLIFCGSLFISLDIEAVKTFVTSSEDLAHLLYAVAKVVGSSMLVGAAYIAYKVLPQATGKS